MIAHPGPSSDTQNADCEDTKGATQWATPKCRNYLLLDAAFDDGERLLAVAEEMQLEGIVSKRRDGPYWPGPRCGWIKTKTRVRRQRNRERWRLFER